MNWINTTWSQQATTATPSSPAVASSPTPARTTTQQAPQDVSAQLAKQLAQQTHTESEPSGIDAMKAAAAQIDTYLRSSGRALQFTVDDVTGTTVVTVKDKATGETIRQIPSEEALRLAQALGSQPNALIDLAV